MPQASQRPARPTLEIAAPRQKSAWPLAAGMLALLLALAVLVLKTKLGVLIGALPPEPGTIDVRTTPAVLGDLLLDDVYRGHPPLFINDVRPGSHRLKLNAAGYLSAEKQVQVETGKAVSVDLTLVQEPPKQPEVVAPPPVVEQPPAAPEHGGQRTSDRSRHHDSHAAASAPATQQQPAAPGAAAAKAGMGTLVVNTVPWSLVTIDGRDTGRTTPLLSYPIAPGLHELRLQIATGRVFVERIEVRPGQTVNVTRRF
jgi:hypothetical protein